MNPIKQPMNPSATLQMMPPSRSLPGGKGFMHQACTLALGLFALLAITLNSSWAQQGRELLVLSGGPALRFYERGKENTHDRHWGNFIDTGVVKLRELLARQQPGDSITWLVYRPAYQIRSVEMRVDLLDTIIKRANALGVPLLWFDTTEQLVNYLNRGKDRRQFPIASLDFFGHSNKACLMFDYSAEYDGQSRVFLHDRDLRRIDVGIFTADAALKSWGCHSGEYFTQRWNKRFGVPLEGAIGKTSYTRPHALPFISTDGGRWVRE